MPSLPPLLRPAIHAIEPEKWNLQRRPDLLKLQYLNAGLRALGLTVWDTLTTHTLVDVSRAGFTAPSFVESLRGNGILVKTCEVYDCVEPGWVFFGIPPLDRVEWALERVKEVIYASE
jgi:hypothetical protein